MYEALNSILSVLEFSTCMSLYISLPCRAVLCRAVPCCAVPCRTHALVVPKWEAKSWWPILVSHASFVEPLQTGSVVFHGLSGPMPAWQFVVALFDF
jgi:hypothetical protein